MDPGARKPAYPRFDSEGREDVGSGITVTLVLGGARSGKSEVAERLASLLPPPVTYVATAVSRPSRPTPSSPPAWRPTGGVGPQPGALSRPGPTWSAPWPKSRGDGPGGCLGHLGGGLPRASTSTGPPCAPSSGPGQASTVVVSEEVGLGVHPSTEVGGRFRDALGAAQPGGGRMADEVLLVVAGRVLLLPGAGLCRRAGDRLTCAPPSPS